MPAQWLSNSSEVAGRVSGALEAALHGLAQPARSRRLRQALFALFALWAVLALARLIWALVPVEEFSTADEGAVLNPVYAQAPTVDADSIDIKRMRGWHLFGEASALVAEPVTPQATDGAVARQGIEDGAQETGLDLKLRGVVASTEDGMGHAIIEAKKRQDVYAVDDKLPVPGQVVLAKVLPRQVVLDNGGKYELLTLYEQSRLDAQLPAAPASQRVPHKPTTDVNNLDKREEAATTALAQNYRERLYKNPQSLAEVVSVSAVRQQGELLGYRVAPGKDQRQFEQLGFKTGDLVTGINGIALNDPANTMRLYQTMRSASEAVFELRRNEQELTVSVSLDSPATAP